MVTCPYCQKAAEHVKGRTLYPTRLELAYKDFWRCAPCKAWVGCHARTTHPLGRLANAQLRKAKQAAHAALDPLWLSGPKGKRSLVYKRLAAAMGLPESECHIGMFDIEQCERVVKLCKGEVDGQQGADTDLH